MLQGVLRPPLINDNANLDFVFVKYIHTFCNDPWSKKENWIEFTKWPGWQLSFCPGEIGFPVDASSQSLPAALPSQDWSQRCVSFWHRPNKQQLAFPSSRKSPGYQPFQWLFRLPQVQALQRQPSVGNCRAERKICSQRSQWVKDFLEFKGCTYIFY